MAYAQIHVQAFRSTKVVALSDSAFRVWVAGLAFCQEHLTDGLIPETALRVLGARVTLRVLQELTTTPLSDQQPLWETTPAGYRVHDYLDWNDSRAQVEQKRRSSRERLQRHRERKAAQAEADQKRRTAEANRNAVSNGALCAMSNGADTIRTDTQYVQPERSRTKSGALRGGVEGERHRPGGRSPSNGRRPHETHPASVNVLVKLTHELLTQDPLLAESEADLKDALKTRVAGCHLTATPDAISHALDQVAAQRARQAARNDRRDSRSSGAALRSVR